MMVILTPLLDLSVVQEELKRAFYNTETKLFIKITPALFATTTLVATFGPLMSRPLISSNLMVKNLFLPVGSFNNGILIVFWDSLGLNLSVP